MMGRPGRRGEGIRLLDGLGLSHHLWRHRALRHLERRDFDAALDLHDRRFRDLRSPLVEAMPDFAADAQNAAPMLIRLELREVGVSRRWAELSWRTRRRRGSVAGSRPPPCRTG